MSTNRTVCMRSSAAAAALCLGFASAAQASVIYVDAAMPDDGGNGLTAATAKKSIAAGIGAAANGDSVEVNAGTYTIPSGTQLIINKQVSLRAKAGLAAKPTITTSYSSWSSCAIQIAASNIVIDGFEITSSWAINKNPNDLVGDYGSAKDNWTVKNCNIHQGYRGIMANGNNITIQGNEIHETYSDCIDCEYGICGGLKVTRNWLHSEHTDLLPNAKPAGITYNCDATAVGDVEISFNYCNSCRAFVDFQHNGGTAPANRIRIMHNTVDWKPTALPSSPIPSGTVAQQMSIAFWTASGNWDASKIDIRDNIFSRQKWYAIVNTSGSGGPLAGSLNLSNNLFYQWYVVDAYYPGNAWPDEWPRARGAVGWWGAYDVAPTFTSDLLADPLYAGTGTTANAYYALTAGSPAHGAASDGTDIGAWQSPPAPEIGDGIPNAWRARYWPQLYSGSVTFTCCVTCATGDASGNGQNNLYKYLADLDPTNPASRLAITSITASNTAASISWIGGGTEAVQFLDARVSLTDTGDWTNIFSYTPTTPAVPSRATYIDPEAATNKTRFYRVRAHRP